MAGVHEFSPCFRSKGTGRSRANRRSAETAPRRERGTSPGRRWRCPMSGFLGSLARQIPARQGGPPSSCASCARNSGCSRAFRIRRAAIYRAASQSRVASGERRRHTLVSAVEGARPGNIFDDHILKIPPKQLAKTGVEYVPMKFVVLAKMLNTR